FPPNALPRQNSRFSASDTVARQPSLCRHRGTDQPVFPTFHSRTSTQSRWPARLYSSDVLPSSEGAANCRSHPDAREQCISSRHAPPTFRRVVDHFSTNMSFSCFILCFLTLLRIGT